MGDMRASDDKRQRDKEQGDLVTEVKELQKSGPRINGAWEEYCDRDGGGTRDPARHGHSFLRHFLESIVPRLRAEEEEDPSPTHSPEDESQSGCESGTEGFEELVQAVKETSRRSRNLNDQWREYCANKGGGTRDPSRHTAKFLRRFLARIEPAWEGERQHAVGSPLKRRLPSEGYDDRDRSKEPEPARRRARKT